jgi:predicted lipid carrier protein YhbT
MAMAEAGRSVLVSLAGLLPLPQAVLDPALAALLAALRRRHPEVLARLDAFAGATVLIDPVELPTALVLTLGATADAASLRAAAKDARATTVVRGPFRVLLALLEGRLDGDGAFFARQLEVAGDTELLLALRNAIDAAEVDLVADLVHGLGPLAAPALAAARAARALGDAVDEALAGAFAALAQPPPTRLAARARRRPVGLPRGPARA